MIFWTDIVFRIRIRMDLALLDPERVAANLTPRENIIYSDSAWKVLATELYTEFYNLLSTQSIFCFSF